MESFSSFPLPLFFFLFDFLIFLRTGLSGLAHQPTKGWCGTPKAYGLPPDGLAPPVNIRNPFVTPGTFPVMPKTFR